MKLSLAAQHFEQMKQTKLVCDGFHPFGPKLWSWFMWYSDRDNGKNNK